MLFSVVVPTYNRAGLLAGSLASVFAQSHRDYEVIVVNDGSTDGTGAYLESLGDRVRVIDQPQRGPGAARNAAVAVAKGEYVAFLDSDDCWFPWTLERMRELIDAAGRPALIIGSTFEFADDRALASVERAPLRYEAFPDFLSSAALPIATGSSAAVVRRDAIAEVGGFTEQRLNCEDHDLALRLGTHAGFAIVREPVTIAWRQHQGTLTTELSRTRAGAGYLVEQERDQRYPGGAARASARWQIITRHVRPVSIALLERGDPSGGLDLYQRTFAWHLRLGRLRYLAWFPLAWMLAAWRGRSRRPA